MSYTLKLTLFDIFRFDNGKIAILCDPEPKKHHVIRKSYPARIVVDGFTDRILNTLGQDIFVRYTITERNSKTVIKTLDNIDDILAYMGKKPINIYIEIPEDEIPQ